MTPIKLWVKKQLETRPNWFHYVPQCWILIDDYSPFKNESDLCQYIYNKFGEGRYLVLAWQKGYSGFWAYWLGNLYSNGYFRDINKNTYIERMKKDYQRELKQAETFEEKREIEEEFEESLEFEREISKEINRGNRRGPLGIRPLRPNVLHGYEEIPENRER